MTVAGTQRHACRLREQRVDEGGCGVVGRGWMEDPGVRQYTQHTAEHKLRQPDLLPAGKCSEQPRAAAVVMSRVLAERAHQDVDVRALHP